MGFAGTQGETPDQFHQMIERKGQGHGLGPRREIAHREKGSAEQKHGGDKKEDGQIEHVDRGRNPGEEHADGTQGQAPQQGHR